MSSNGELILLGDIGGTNARFCLYDGAQSGLFGEQVLATAQFAGPVEAIRTYLQQHSEHQPVRAALAVAAPVAGDDIRLTNERWNFSIRQLREALNLRQLAVINDFAAQALSIPSLAAADTVAVGEGSAAAGAVGVLGPGTGLGVAGLVQAQQRWVAIPGEGGHVTLAAITPRQEAVVARLRQRYTHVSAERVLSGQGLVALYQALCELDGETAQPLTPAAVSDRGREGSCPRCVGALDLFFEFLGVVAGNLALTLGATGGVYLAGGILPRLLEPLRASRFRDCFVAKGRFSDYLGAIPTRVIVHPQPAFLGLVYRLHSDASDAVGH